MSLAGSLTDYISGQAQKQLAPYASLLPKGGNVGLPVSLSGSASSSASSGPSKSGDISGGTAFNIGGINLGQQYESPATATGGNPASTLSGQLGLGVGGISLTTIALVAGIALLAVIVLRR